MNMKKFFAILLAAMMVFSLAACSGGSEEPAAPAEGGEAEGEAAEGGEGAVQIHIGATGPLTGGAAIYGQAVKNGAEIAVDEVNAMGGIQFIFQMEDDTHDPEKAENAYNALVDWGMDMMMGTVTSAPAEVTAADAYADRYFFLTPSASSTNVIDGKDNIFQMCFTDPNQGSGSATYIAENNMAEKIAIIWKNDAKRPSPKRPRRTSLYRSQSARKQAQTSYSCPCTTNLLPSSSTRPTQQAMLPPGSALTAWTASSPWKASTPPWQKA